MLGSQADAVTEEHADCQVSESQCLEEEGRGKHGKFSGDDDKKLIEAYEHLGPKWSEIAKVLPGRTEKQVRRHYVHRFDPTINKDAFCEAEDKKLIEAYEHLGPKVEQNRHGAAGPDREASQAPLRPSPRPITSITSTEKYCQASPPCGIHLASRSSFLGVRYFAFTTT